MKQRIILFAIIAAIALLSSSTIVNAPTDPYWFDTSWHFRVMLTMSNTNYARDNWTIEQNMNFTALISQAAKNGTFNYASIRVYEHNSTGGVMHLMKHQFDNASEYDALSNAAGTLVFLLNGTTSADEIRYFYVYFDIIENGAKSPASFTTNLNYSWDGEEAHVNNSLLKWKIDTLRAENTSGIYAVSGNENIFVAGPNSRTNEYVQYSNETDLFSFDFRNNATNYSGPVKLVIEQIGNEILWNNPDETTGFGIMKKRYTFYEDSKWIKIEQNFTNIGASAILRNSTHGGALSMNYLLDNGLDPVYGNESNPLSRYCATNGQSGVGIINLNYSSNANYYATYDSDLNRIGITLENIILEPSESITETAAMQFDDLGYIGEAYLTTLKDQLLYPPIISEGVTQFMPYSSFTDTNYTIHNRDETTIIFANTTSDPYNIINSTNATLNMGTSEPSDDTTIMLYDDGSALHGDATAFDGIFSNFFNLSNSSVIGIWNVTTLAYDADGILLNESSATFNVTDIYNVTLNITNPDGIVDRLINATITVLNYRYDTYIGGAAINCSYPGSGELTNITDYNNGTYILNFTAPASTGTYTLTCNASKFNNTGMNPQQFYTETSKTTMSINITPENHTETNISLSAGSTFNISINTTDIDGANARFVNITLSMPQNLSAIPVFENCGTVNMSESCIRNFSITIANETKPGNYTINASVIWENLDATTNTTNTSFIAYVLSNPIINISTPTISGIILEGKTSYIGNFTISSVGNDNLTNITFNVTGIPNFTMSFIPQNISSIASGATQNISINVTVPEDHFPGIFTGTINVSSINGGWKILEANLTIPSKTLLSISKLPQNYTSANISYSSGELFNITVNITNMDITRAKNVNITLSVPSKISADSYLENCGNISSGASCAKSFNITISNQTAPGTYTFNITSSWNNPDQSINSTMTNFTAIVLSNPIMNASEEWISTILADNSSAFAGNFTVYSIGNDNLTNITFNITGLPNINVTFWPINISTLGMNDSRIISINVTVPFAYSPGNYTGLINISSKNDGWKTVNLNVSVSIRHEWTISPSHCERSEVPDEGIVCNVVVSNTGNAPMNFTVDAISVNHTYANKTNFTIQKNSSYALPFLYNVTNITKEIFYENYTINATDYDALPQYYDFNITLVPFSVPLFSLNISHTEAEQNQNIEIFANITDESTTGFNWTSMSVMLPNGTVELHNMTLLETDGVRYQFYYNYSGTMPNGGGNNSNYTGSTLLRGDYNITISAQNNAGTMSEISTLFNIHIKTIIGFMSGSTKYYQGSTGSIYYTITDAEGKGISGANVTLHINDSTGNITYIQTFSTSSTGQIFPTPTFALPSDARVGLYTLTANTTYYDSIANKTLTRLNNASFTIQSGSSGGGGGLAAYVDTAVVWYPDNVMRFEMWFSYAGNVTDPDNMTLQVFDPAGNTYLNISLNNANRTSTGLYNYKYAMPINTASGYYFAVLTASKDGFISQMVKPFRVAKGGPYDVKLKILPPLEVSRQDYLNFEVMLENMGEVTQDVYIDYWTSYDDTTYYYSGEAVLTPVGVNKTIIRTAYIFSNQPLGMNTLNIKVTYDNVQAPILLTGTFEVTEENIIIPPPPKNGTPPPPTDNGDQVIERFVYLPPKEPLVPKTEKIITGSQIEIESYKKDINIVRGWTALESVKVKNSGITQLTNITLSLTGIPSSWFKITPDIYESLPQRNNTVFLIEFKIPNNIDSGSYGLTFTAGSSESLTEKVGRLIVFTSIEDLIKQELMTLKIDIEKLEEDTDYSENLGRDVSEVRDIISSARAQIKLAEDNVNKKSFDDALLNTQTASGLIKRGKRILESLGADASLSSQKPIQSAWLFGLEALLIIIIIAAIALWMVRSRGKFKWDTIKAYLKKSEKKTNNEDRKKELANEKERIIRMTKLLENELKEGIITQNAYNELRKRNDEKLSKLERELKTL